MSISFIPLTKGEVSIVDSTDFESLSKFKWTLKSTRYKKYAYRQYKENGRMIQVLLHRYVSNCPVDMVVDHSNGNGLDNRKSNLRICTQSENLSNISAHVDRKYILPKGVGYKPNRKANPYYAQISKNGIRHFLGVFTTVELAEIAYKTKDKELFGEFVH